MPFPLRYSNGFALLMCLTRAAGFGNKKVTGDERSSPVTLLYMGKALLLSAIFTDKYPSTATIKYPVTMYNRPAIIRHNNRGISWAVIWRGNISRRLIIMRTATTVRIAAKSA